MTVYDSGVDVDPEEARMARLARWWDGTDSSDRWRERLERRKRSGMRKPALAIDATDLFRVTDLSASTPVILHAPHAGRIMPAELSASFVIDATEIEAKKDAMTDSFTDILVRSAAGASSMINDLSRLAVDVERFPDDSEEMNAVGMGVLYTHGSRRQEIRKLRPRDETRLLDFYCAYSDQFARLVDSTLDVHGRAVIVDVHSCQSTVLPYELQPGQRRPQLCVGSDPFHAGARLLASVAAAFGHLETAANEPFSGSYLPLKHLHSDARVQSVMLEFRRDVYMDERMVTLERRPFQALQESLQQLVDRVAQG